MPAPSTNAPTLVLAAIASELGNISDRAVVTHTLGVGIVEAALSLSDTSLTRPWSSVWLLGTAGAYGSDGLEIGSVVAADRHVWVPQAGGSHAGYLPAPVPTIAEPSLPPVDFGALPMVGCATTPTVTTDPNLAGAIARDHDVAVEHLEAFAIARWCETRHIPFAAVLGISNIVGPDAHQEWTSNRDGAEAAARQSLIKLLG